MNWQTMDTAPKDGRQILIRSQSHRIEGRNGERVAVPCSMYHLAYWWPYESGEGGRFCEGFCNEVLNATHWAPLTEPEQPAVAA